MAEPEARDWALVLAEDLHRRAGSTGFWEEQERIDPGTHSPHTDGHSGMKNDKSRCFL